MKKVHKIILVAIGCVIVVLGLFLFLTRPPHFPVDFPSPKTAGKQEIKQLNQQEFFEEYTNIIREKHGGLIVAKQQQKADSLPEPTKNFVSYFHQFKFFDKDVIFNLATKIAEKNQLGLRVKQLETSNFKGYEIDFIRNKDIWLRIQIDPGENGEMTTTDLSNTAVQPTNEELSASEFSATKKISGGSPKMILIIDDMGQNINIFQDLSFLNENITFSILPFLPHSLEIAETAGAMGLEVMLHLPMQPQDWPEKNPGEGALMLDDDEAQLTKKLEEIMAFVPNAVGTNNHMGSAFMQNSVSMDVVMRNLSARNMFFLDSKTSSGNIAKNLAKRYKVTYYSRDIFIDNDQDENLIIKQLNKAVKIAKRKGRVVVIGHPYKITYQTLKNYLPVLEEQGIKLVRASWLLNF